MGQPQVAGVAARGQDVEVGHVGQQGRGVVMAGQVHEIGPLPGVVRAGSRRVGGEDVQLVGVPVAQLFGQLPPGEIGAVGQGRDFGPGGVGVPGQALPQAIERTEAARGVEAHLGAGIDDDGDGALTEGIAPGHGGEKEIAEMHVEAAQQVANELPADANPFKRAKAETDAVIESETQGNES